MGVRAVADASGARVRGRRDTHHEAARAQLLARV